MIRTVSLNGQKITYDLTIKPVKNINLRIKADQSIHVSANDRVSEEVIDDFLISKSDYILNSLNRYAEMVKYIPKPKQYINGESFRIFGHDRRLHVLEGKRNRIESDESYITLLVKDKNNTDNFGKIVAGSKMFKKLNKIGSSQKCVFLKKG